MPHRRHRKIPKRGRSSLLVEASLCGGIKYAATFFGGGGRVKGEDHPSGTDLSAGDEGESTPPSPPLPFLLHLFLLLLFSDPSSSSSPAPPFSLLLPSPISLETRERRFMCSPPGISRFSANETAGSEGKGGARAAERDEEGMEEGIFGDEDAILRGEISRRKRNISLG